MLYPLHSPHGERHRQAHDIHIGCPSSKNIRVVVRSTTGQQKCAAAVDAQYNANRFPPGFKSTSPELRAHTNNSTTNLPNIYPSLLWGADREARSIAWVEPLLNAAVCLHRCVTGACPAIKDFKQFGRCVDVIKTAATRLLLYCSL